MTFESYFADHLRLRWTRLRIYRRRGHLQLTTGYYAITSVAIKHQEQKHESRKYSEISLCEVNDD